MKHILFDDIRELDKCQSTMIEAKEKIDSLTGNVLFIAQEQSSAIGRTGSHWSSPCGGLWFTCAMLNLDIESNFTLFVGQCLHKTILNFDKSLNLSIKWPNDIYLGGKKLAGIIIHKVKKYHLIGIGINTNNDIEKSLQNIAVSLKTKKKVNNSQLLGKFLDIFAFELNGYLENGLDNCYCNRYLYLHKKKVTIATEFSDFIGTVQEIDKNGAIILKLKGGLMQPFFVGKIK